MIRILIIAVTLLNVEVNMPPREVDVQTQVAQIRATWKGSSS